MALYADVYFILNFAADYLILLCAAFLSGVPASRMRIAAGALFGAAYALTAALRPHPFQSVPFKLCAAAAMAVIAYGKAARLFRVLCVFLCVAAAIGGMMYAMELSSFTVTLPMLLIVLAASCSAVSLFFRNTVTTAAGSVTVEAWRGGRHVSFRALSDTGNRLRDPVSGEAVIVAEYGGVLPLFEGAEAEAVSALQSRGAVSVMEELASPAFRLIPYSSVGGHGLLLAFSPDRLTVNGKRKRGTLIAMTSGQISDNGTFSAVIGA